MANELGQRIRRSRERKGWTQQQLALELGVSPRTIGGWERGETVPQNRIGRLEEIFGAEVNPENDRAVRVARGGRTNPEVAVMFAHFDELSQLELFRLSHLIQQIALGQDDSL